MPELPDLTIYARGLRRLTQGLRIEAAEVYNKAKVSATPEAFARATTGQCIESIDRNGKELFFTLDSGSRFAVHLMLFGRFSFMPWLDTHTVNAKIISLRFEGGDALVISDTKGMCRVTLNPPQPGVPDALSDAFTFDYFQRQAKAKPMANIKALLIDQHVVRGIGNAYVDEILYDAHISPKSVCGAIPPEYLYVLYESIRNVLEDAISQLTRLAPDSISGEERSFLRVHNPRKKQTAAGEIIHCEEIARKRTYYADSQRLFV